jgi:precorrin-3B synthase
MVESSCPSVAHMLGQVDGGLVRIRLPGGRITAPQVAVVADAARTLGADVIEITNRANLQLRGIVPSSAQWLADRLRAAGLSAGEQGDRRRNILVGPLAGLDPSEAVDVSGLIRLVLDRFDGERRLDALSPKYGVILDGGGRWHLRGRRDDAVVTVGAGVGGRPTFEVRVADQPVQIVEEEEVADVVLGAALSTLGDRPRRLVAAPRLSPDGPVPEPAAGPIGSGAQRDPGRRWVGAMPVLGRMNGATAGGLADVAERYSGGRLRLTPWRGLVLGDVASPAAPAAVRAFEGLGLLTQADDPATAVMACAGYGCPSSLTDAAHDARAIIAARREQGRRPLLVHVSGCEKRCAHHGPAAVTLVGVGPGRYDMLVADASVPGGERRLAGSLDAPRAVAAAACDADAVVSR